jgi:hypothetical protein
MMSIGIRISKLESQEAGHEVFVVKQGREETHKDFELRVDEAKNSSGPEDILVIIQRPTPRNGSN